MATVTVAAAGLVAGIATGSPVVFIIAGVVGGLGMGIAMTSSMRSLIPFASPVERAGLLSLTYSICYTGAALPSLAAGQLSRSLSLLEITAGYTALCAAALLVALFRRTSDASTITTTTPGKETHS